MDAVQSPPRDVEPIYHLVWQSDWTAVAADGLYRPASLTAEGFIHLTREPEKVVEVANLFYPGPGDEPLLLLTIDPARLTAPLKYEDPGCGWLFPHLYGPMERTAATNAAPLRWTADGWRLPTA
ncbi:MAG: DUF952 domain-containing protein [Planctomycetia bacterium]